VEDGSDDVVGGGVWSWVVSGVCMDCVIDVW